MLESMADILSDSLTTAPLIQTGDLHSSPHHQESATKTSSPAAVSGKTFFYVFFHQVLLLYYTLSPVFHVNWQNHKKVAYSFEHFFEKSIFWLNSKICYPQFLPFFIQTDGVDLKVCYRQIKIWIKLFFMKHKFLSKQILFDFDYI